MEAVVLESVVVVVQLRLRQTWVHWRPGAREKPVDGEGVRGGILKYLLFIDFLSARGRLDIRKQTES